MLDGQTENSNLSSRSAESAKPELADVSIAAPTAKAGALDAVGMTGLEMPVSMKSTDGSRFRVPAKISAFVSLDDSQARGIHMSRLYVSLRERLSREDVDSSVVKTLLEEFVSGQRGLSRSGHLRIEWQLPVERAALVSGELGWRQYPVWLEGTLNEKGVSMSMGLRVLYSSTCPCSAALSRQVIQEKFAQDFAGRGSCTPEEVWHWLGLASSMAATPHAQRSEAEVEVRVGEGFESPSWIELIDGIEGVLGTPVQAAVKRVDEREFARRNAQNLMFCEDAARRIRSFLEADGRFVDYRLVVDHVESLHPHSAVARVTKGVAGGWTS